MLFHSYLVLLKRDLLVAQRNLGDYSTPVIFFIVITTMFAFAGDSNPQLLTRIGAGVIWVSALLASMLSLDGMFRTDFEDGSLDQLLTAPFPTTVLIFAKVSANWILTGVPLICICPLLGILMNMNSYSIWMLMITLIISTPVFSLIGAFGASLLVTQKRTGMLLALLMLPLCIPVLIFSISAVANAQAELPLGGHLSLLLGYLILSLALSPPATAGALRITAGD